MLQLKTKDLINGSELSGEEILSLLDFADELKEKRTHGFGNALLKGKSLALIFDKPSLRTRMSFSIAMSELGGHSIESLGPTRKKEEPRDFARVLQGYVHGIMIRTFSDMDIIKMAETARIPVINGLSDEFHPCQTLADLQTIRQAFGKLNKLTLAYVGDGNNILQSFFPIASKLGLKINYACPKGYEPKDRWVGHFPLDLINGYSNPVDAVKGADVVYTDVWTSMGMEKEASERLANFKGFQVNEELLKHASKEAKVLHCLPMNRGEEISDSLPESEHSLIFSQCENRLHVQKALLVGLMAKG